MISWVISIGGRSSASITSCHQLNETESFNYDSPPCLLSVFSSLDNPPVEQANTRKRAAAAAARPHTRSTTMNKHTRNHVTSSPADKTPYRRSIIYLRINKTQYKKKKKMPGLTKPHLPALPKSAFMKFMKMHTKNRILHTTRNTHRNPPLTMLVRNIKKALGTAFLDAVKSKRRKGALSHNGRR